MNKTVTESGESNGDHFIVIVSETVNDNLNKNEMIY